MRPEANPKLDSKAERVRFCVRKKYISEEEWSNKELAEELNVNEEIISRYLNNTPHAKEIQRTRDTIEKEQWRQLVTDLMERIDKLSHLEEQVWDIVEPAITGYEFVSVDAEISDFHLQDSGNSVQLEIDEEERPEQQVEIPVPEQWKEVPEFHRLRSIWDERRRTEEQLATILGLEADETVNVSGELTEKKIFEIAEDDYPDVEPHEKGTDSPESSSDEQEDISTSDDEESAQEGK